MRPHLWHLQDMGSGAVVLLIHGAGASTHSWRDILPRLAVTSRAIAIDLPGQGFTRLGSRGRCGLQAMSADIAALLEDQGIAPAAIVGHSAGAAIALRLALDLPSPPVALVGINPALGRFRGPAATIFPALAKMLSLTPGMARVLALTASVSRVRRLVESIGSHLDPRGIELYRLLLSDRDHVAATLCMMAHWDLTELLKDLGRTTAPTLFLAGSRDRAVRPDTADSAARLIPDAKVERSCFGHLLHEEDPDGVAVLIRDWLGSAASQRNLHSHSARKDQT